MTLVERLRKGSVRYYSRNRPVYSGPTSLEREAADRISTLEAELEKAREAALEEAAKASDKIADAMISSLGIAVVRKSDKAKISAAAAAAIRSLSHKEG